MNKCNGQEQSKVVDLESEINNKMAMAIDTSKVFGGSVELGFGQRRTDMFWIVMSIIIAGVLIMLGLNKKRRR